MLTAKRTLVKSGPELWAEVSDPEALGSLFAPFGEIRITRVTDASLVVGVGEGAAGRLELEPSGFGTRVHLSAEVGARELPPPPAPEPEPAPRPGFWSRLFRRTPEAAAPPPPPQSVSVPAMADAEALAVLTGTLDALGMARHRPFSR